MSVSQQNKMSMKKLVCSEEGPPITKAIMTIVLELNKALDVSWWPPHLTQAIKKALCEPEQALEASSCPKPPPLKIPNEKSK
jgi:hypothetical protein